MEPVSDGAGDPGRPDGLLPGQHGAGNLGSRCAWPDIYVAAAIAGSVDDHPQRHRVFASVALVAGCQELGASLPDGCWGVDLLYGVELLHLFLVSYLHILFSLVMKILVDLCNAKTFFLFFQILI